MVIPGPNRLHNLQGSVQNEKWESLLKKQPPPTHINLAVGEVLATVDFQG